MVKTFNQNDFELFIEHLTSQGYDTKALKNELVSTGRHVIPNIGIIFFDKYSGIKLKENAR